MRVRPLLSADGTCPSTTWLVKSYPSNIRLTGAQKKINKSLSSARVIVERAFGLSKGRRLIRLDNDIEYVTKVRLSCFVLHNITKISGGKYTDYENLLDINIREERNAHFRKHRCPNGFQENSELRDPISPTRSWY